MLNAELARNRRDDVRVGAGHQRQLVTAVAVRFHQRQRFASNVRANMLVHKVPMPRIEHRTRKERQQFHLKSNIAFDVERTSLVRPREFLNACAVNDRIQPPC